MQISVYLNSSQTLLIVVGTGIAIVSKFTVPGDEANSLDAQQQEQAKQWCAVEGSPFWSTLCFPDLCCFFVAFLFAVICALFKHSNNRSFEAH